MQKLINVYANDTFYYGGSIAYLLYSIHI